MQPGMLSGQLQPRSLCAASASRLPVRLHTLAPPCRAVARQQHQEPQHADRIASSAQASTSGTDAQHVHASPHSLERTRQRVPKPPSATGWDCSPALLLASLQLVLAQAALAADDVVAYNAAEGEETLKNVAGVAYVILVGIFLTRVLSRRAKRAREERIAGPQSGDGSTTEGQPPSIFDKLREKLGANKVAGYQTGPKDTFLGALQAGAFAFGLYTFTMKMSAAVSATGLPEGYTARNLSITVRTIVLGFGWLMTFIFAANALGLSGLTIQWLLFPGSIKSDEEEAAERRAAVEAAGPQLPKVSVTSKPDEVRRAFEEAERERDAKKKKSGIGMGQEAETLPGGLKLMDRLNDTASTERLND